MDDGNRGKIEAEITQYWASLQDKYNGMPKGVDKLRDKIFLWLEGETVEFVEFGWDDDEAFNAAEADKLWGFILTHRFAVFIQIPKPRESKSIGAPEWSMVPRAALNTLDYEWVGGAGSRWMKVHATFTGLPRPVIIPQDDRWEVDADARRQIFLSLREDLFTQQ